MTTYYLVALFEESRRKPPSKRLLRDLARRVAQQMDELALKQSEFDMLAELKAQVVGVGGGTEFSEQDFAYIFAAIGGTREQFAELIRAFGLKP